MYQGYNSKAYEVLNHNLKSQCKKLNRTRDIRNFPTQGWGDTTFCTRKRSETYKCMWCGWCIWQTINVICNHSMHRYFLLFIFVKLNIFMCVLYCIKKSNYYLRKRSCTKVVPMWQLPMIHWVSLHITPCPLPPDIRPWSPWAPAP